MAADQDRDVPGSKRQSGGGLAVAAPLRITATIVGPELNPFFKAEPLIAGELGFALGRSTVVFAQVEVERLVKRGRRPATLNAAGAARRDAR